MKFAVVLDNVRSLYNVGSLFRLADGLGVDEIVLVGKTAIPPHPGVAKTALGSEQAVSWQYFSSTDDVVSHLVKNFDKVIVLELADIAVPVDELVKSLALEKFVGSCALVVGSETEGVDSRFCSIADHVCFIPMQGVKGSLNVSTAAAIAIWELRRVLKR